MVRNEHDEACNQHAIRLTRVAITDAPWQGSNLSDASFDEEALVDESHSSAHTSAVGAHTSAGSQLPPTSAEDDDDWGDWE